MHSIKQCGSLKVLELKHECWVIPASGSWWSQLLDIMWDKLITREARRWVQTTFVPDYTSAATRCLFVALLQFGGNENISSTPDPNQDQRKLNWSSQGRNFNLNIYCLCTVSGPETFPHQVYSRPHQKAVFPLHAYLKVWFKVILECLYFGILCMGNLIEHNSSCVLCARSAGRDYSWFN